MNGIPWWYFHAHGGPLDGQVLPRLDPGNALRDAVGMRRVIGGVVHSPCTVIEPGVIEVTASRSRLVLGEPDGTISARAEAIATALRAGGVEGDVTPRIRDAIWSKLAQNLAGGPIAVLTRSPPLGSLVEPACEAARQRIVAAGVEDHDAGARLVVEAGQPDIVISALPVDRVVKRLLDLPFKDGRRLHQVVPFALEEHLPFPVDNGTAAGRLVRPMLPWLPALAFSPWHAGVGRPPRARRGDRRVVRRLDHHGGGADGER